jgi:polar amino acid transport system substrate-binding protein
MPLALVLISAICYSSPQGKVLRWAADAEGNAPFIFQSPDDREKNIGFEVDIVRAIAEKLGYSEVFVQNQWDGLIPGLERNDYDIAINGIEITEDRKEEVNFSVPYYITYEQLIVRKEQEGVASLDDLRGRRVGALKESVAERILRQTPGIEVRTYDGEVFAYADLENQRLEAVLVDAPLALYYASWNKKFKLVGRPVGEISYGIAIRKTDTTLLKEINSALSVLITSGQLRTILDEWNLWNDKMGSYTNDNEPSKVEPVKYNAFIEDQMTEITMDRYFQRFLDYMPMLGQGALITLGLSIVSMSLAILLGLFIALTRVYAPAPFSSSAVAYIEIIRGTPLLIQLFVIFYALPSIGIKLSPFIAAVIGLGCNYAAYEAENYRAGLFSVPRGQMEAAISLGMSRNQALRFVILPQALRMVLPPVTNDFISLLKDSSLVSVITMVELTKVYTQIASNYYDYLGTGIIVAILYLLLGLPFVRLSRFVEKKFSYEKKVIV